jgi:hypothetical protein
MSPSEIRKELALALCDERKIVIDEKGTGDFMVIDEFINGEYKNRFFERVLKRIKAVDYKLSLHAEWARNFNRNVARRHIRLDRMENFLISVNYFLGQQRDLQHNKTTYCHRWPGSSERTQSAFYIFVDNLPGDP